MQFRPQYRVAKGIGLMMFWLAFGELALGDEISTVFVVMVLVIFLFLLWRDKRRDSWQIQANEKPSETQQDQDTQDII